MKITDHFLAQDPVARGRVIEELRVHAETLRSIQRSAAERAEKYLVLTNGGGVVTCLSFMGAFPGLREKPTVWIVLGFFVAGVILCGILAAINYHTSDSQLRGWIQDTNRFLKGEIDAEDIYANLMKSVGRTAFMGPLAGWLAYAVFVSGCAMAILKLRP
jgi:hypothetical protein